MKLIRPALDMKNKGANDIPAHLGLSPQSELLRWGGSQGWSIWKYTFFLKKMP